MISHKYMEQYDLSHQCQRAWLLTMRESHALLIHWEHRKRETMCSMHANKAKHHMTRAALMLHQLLTCYCVCVCVATIGLRQWQSCWRAAPHNGSVHVMCVRLLVKHTSSA